MSFDGPDTILTPEEIREAERVAGARVNRVPTRPADLLNGGKGAVNDREIRGVRDRYERKR